MPRYRNGGESIAYESEMLIVQGLRS